MLSYQIISENEFLNHIDNQLNTGENSENGFISLIIDTFIRILLSNNKHYDDEKNDDYSHSPYAVGVPHECVYSRWR